MTGTNPLSQISKFFFSFLINVAGSRNFDYRTILSFSFSNDSFLDLDDIFGCLTKNAKSVQRTSFHLLTNINPSSRLFKTILFNLSKLSKLLKTYYCVFLAILTFLLSCEISTKLKIIWGEVYDPPTPDYP